MSLYDALTSSRKPIGTTARTGETCPESGNWTAIGYPGSSAPIAKGNRMPPHASSAVVWRLYQHA